VDETTNTPNVENQAMPNPLQQYMRQPQIYMKLPSEGKYYPPGVLEMPINGELPVYSLSTKDELLLNTPDALMNGQGVVDVIQSCIPAIKNAWYIPTVDVDAILIAIRIASYGEMMEYQSTCPKCEESNNYEIDLRQWLDKKVDVSLFDAPFRYKELEIFIKPNDYRSMNDANLEAFEQQRLVQTVNDSTMSEQEKQNRFNEIFAIMTRYTVRSMAGAIERVVVPGGASISDEAHILEFVENADRNLYQQLKKHVETALKQIPEKSVPASCPECQHQYSTPFTFDQSNFFVFASSA